MDNSNENNDEDNASLLSNLSELNNNKINDDNYDLIIDEYSCNICNHIPEIRNINFEKNTLDIKCPLHQTEIKWTDFINNSFKSNYYFSVCNICNKNIQKNFENIFKYCYDCKKIICPQCYKTHNSEHNVIKNNEFNSKCQKHYNQTYSSFCVNCQQNICNECKKTKIHKGHNKYDFLEIEPTEEEISQIMNFSSKLSSNIELLNNYDKNEIAEINKFKERKLFLINELYTAQMEKIKNDIKQKRKEASNNYKGMLYDLKKKYLEDLQKVKEEYNKVQQNLNNELNNKINSFNQKYSDILNDIKGKYNDLISKCIIYSQKLKTKYKSLIILNDLITKSYFKNKTQYYYIINISNIINFNKSYLSEMPKLFIKDINNKYNIKITQENLIIENNIITTEGIKYILSKINKEKLKNILLDKTNINSLEFLGKFNFPYLNSFCINGCNIQDIDKLSLIYCPNILILNLSNNRISDINSLKKTTFNTLEILELRNNNISNINVLEEDIFNNLKKLDLSYNHIVDISVFNRVKFTKIEELNLSYNNIKVFYILNINHLNNLKSLIIDNQK